MILSIETSTPTCTVAIHQGEELLGSYGLHAEKSHSEALTQMIDHLLKMLKVTYSQLSGVAISQGPGSYTGLRIGTSVAKGLCFGLDIPLIAVSTLKAMASGICQYYQGQNVWLCPMLDARRMEVYTALYTSDLGEAQPVQAKIIDETSFRQEMEEKRLVIFGNGAQKCAEAMAHPNLVLLQGIFPSAVEMGTLAHQKFLQEDFADTAYFEPFYLKAFKAGVPKRKSLLI